MKDHIELKSLSMDELTGVVNLYPWFGSARKELFTRLLALGGGEATQSAYADAAMFVPSRKAIVKLFRDKHRKTWADKDAQDLLKAYIAPEAVAGGEDGAEGNQRKIYVVGGDYFSQDQYEKVKKSGDSAFSRFLGGSHEEHAEPDKKVSGDEVDIYTETLAQIYADQGYYEQAKRIYSKLILAYPKKNTYFAALIQKLEQNQSTI